MATIVFVHGTGVRLEAYAPALAAAQKQATKARIGAAIVPCAWGDPLGISFAGLSLPDPPPTALVEEEARELAQWSCLFDDPLAELERLAIRDARALMVSPGLQPEWQRRLVAIRAYAPSDEVCALLERTGVADLWHSAFAAVVRAPVVDTAFERSAAAHELADAIAALARAAAAELHRGAQDNGRPAPSADLRDRLCRILIADWGGAVAGLGTFLSNMFRRAGTSMLRRRRATINAAIAGPIGDILLYQSHGCAIRDFIRGKIEAATGPVTLVAHSLGGIACVDLLAAHDPPAVSRLVTIGSQAAYFHELGALAALAEGDELPSSFPPWLNIYDRNDFLSFVAERVFAGRVRDFEVKSGQPFPDAHSAYLGSPTVWAEIASFTSA